MVLKDLEVEFFLLVTNDGALGARLEKILLGFLRHQKLLLYVVKVSVAEDSSAAGYLGATYVPQVRFYRHGREVGRHRGLASYEVLGTLVGLPT